MDVLLLDLRPPPAVHIHSACPLLTDRAHTARRWQTLTRYAGEARAEEAKLIAERQAEWARQHRRQQKKRAESRVGGAALSLTQRIKIRTMSVLARTSRTSGVEASQLGSITRRGSAMIGGGITARRGSVNPGAASGSITARSSVPTRTTSAREDDTRPCAGVRASAELTQTL